MTPNYIRAMHPKKGIRPSPEVISKILRSGWVAQKKINGHRAQIHLLAGAPEGTVVYNRQGRPHKIPLPEKTIGELFRIFKPAAGWTVLDGEWIKKINRVYIFDLLKKDGETLRNLTYEQRHALLPRDYISPFVRTLPILRTLETCLLALEQPDDSVEGLVFKSPTRKGFEDSSIIRCRKLVTMPTQGR